MGSRLATSRCPPRRVDDVDRLVLAVRAGDAEEDREPAPEAELPLAGELPPEDERPADLVDSRPRAAAATPFTNTSKGTHLGRQLHVTPGFHALYDATRRAPHRLSPAVVTSIVALQR